MDESPSEELIEGWITQYGRLYTIHHQDVVYWYRQLSRREYKLLLGVSDEAEREEQLVETCLLWPADWKIDDHLDDLAGNVQMLSNEILAASGCVDLKATSDGYRQAVSQDVELQMEATIDHIFGGGGNFRRYLDWSYDQLFDTYARAEWVAVNIMGKKVEQQSNQPVKPRKRGLANPEEDPRPQRNAADSIPDMDTRPMAQRPMSEVLKLQAVTARRTAMRQIWDKVPSSPIVPGSS